MPHDRKPQFYNRYPMLWLAAGFASGVAAADFLNVDLRLSFTACILFAFASFIFRGHRFGSILILLAFASAGIAGAVAEKSSVAPDRLKILYDNSTLRSGDPVEIEGVLLGRPEPSADGAVLSLSTKKLTIRGQQIDVSGNVRLYLTVSPSETSLFQSPVPNLNYGSRLKIATKLDRDDEFLNPGVISKIQILDRLGIDAVGSIKSVLLIEKIADESVCLPLAWVYNQRANLIESFRANLSPRAAGVLIASMLGNKNFLDKSTADLFREGGTFHILVISGLHITFIGGLLLWLLRRITSGRWLQFATTTSILWGYAMAVGAEIPVVRATIMMTVLLFSFVIYRQIRLLNSLGFCTLILLVWRPSDIFNPSFQLTFVSVAAIVAVALPLIETLRKIGGWMPNAETTFPPDVPRVLKRLCESLYWNAEVWAYESKRQIWSGNIEKSPYLSTRVRQIGQKTFRRIFEGLLVSLIVQIFLLPLSVIYFHRVSVMGIFLNLWVGINIVFLALAAVVATAAAEASSLLAAGLFAVAELFTRLMLVMPGLFSDAGLLNFRLPAYPGNGWIVYFLYFIPILYLAAGINHWRPFELRRGQWWLRRNFVLPGVAGFAVLLFVIIFHPFSSPPADGRLKIDFLDVGQGDAALVTFPDGTTLLVDGGGRKIFRRDDDESEMFERDVRGIGEAVVSEFLWHRGYSRIDHILATHADADHMQGLSDVTRNFRLGSAIVARTPAPDADFADLAATLSKRGVPVEIVSRGDRLNVGGATLEILYPIKSDDPDAVSDNDHSIVLRIIFGHRVFLLTGDIERRAETELVSSGGTLEADLIKVAHHGSRTSSTQAFVEAVGAKYAVIPVGRSSPFGHPHPDVVQRWNAAGAVVMTTGERGMISVSTNGKDLEIVTFTK